MWKFRASKYKNAAPKLPKKEEWLSDLPVSNILQSCGNHVKASATLMAFNTDSSGGGNIAVLPLGAHGRHGIDIPLIQAHSEYVTDLDFSPFDDYILATGSQDCMVKIWRVPETGIHGSLCSPECTVTSEERRIENVLWHPTTEGVLAITTNTTAKVFDVNQKKSLFAFDGHADLVQSLSWKEDGTVFATSCKDKKLRILDPRANNIVAEADGPQNIKDSRVLWLAGKELILTTGFDMMRQREVRVRDARNLSASLKSVTSDAATGILMPLYDGDTGMLFLAGKGDTCIRYMEVTDKDPYITDASMDTTEQVKGIAMVPKRAMDVKKKKVPTATLR